MLRLRRKLQPARRRKRRARSNLLSMKKGLSVFRAGSPFYQAGKQQRCYSPIGRFSGIW
jgi:hypothetical protein